MECREAVRTSNMPGHIFGFNSPAQEKYNRLVTRKSLNPEHRGTNPLELCQVQTITQRESASS